MVNLDIDLWLVKLLTVELILSLLAFHLVLDKLGSLKCRWPVSCHTILRVHGHLLVELLVSKLLLHGLVCSLVAPIALNLPWEPILLIIVLNHNSFLSISEITVLIGLYLKRIDLRNLLLLSVYHVKFPLL